MSEDGNGYIETHPKECLQILVLIPFFILQSVAAFLGCALYFLLIRLLKVKWWMVLVAGVVTVALAIFTHHLGLSEIFVNNKNFWFVFFKEGVTPGLFYLHDNIFPLVTSLPLLIAGLMGLINLIPITPHAKEMLSLHGKQAKAVKELNDKKVSALLGKLDDKNYNGTLLGISKINGKPVVIPDNHINQIALVLGTTGAGKSITMRRFYKRAILKGHPVLFVTGKPTTEEVSWMSEVARKCNKKFYGFNCDNFKDYDPLSHGDYTELKDKIISLKDEWSSDYYRSIAEDYLQTTFEILIKSGTSFDLATVVDFLDYDKLTDLVRKLNDKHIAQRVRRLEQYDKRDITGLQAHLGILVNSVMGTYLKKGENSFDLQKIIDEGAVAYFALPALRFPSFAKVLGKLIINDIKAAVDRQPSPKKIFTFFDEFSVFAGSQILNLINMGRAQGVHAILGTQGLADLREVSEVFESQVLNCANTVICHRLNDQQSAEEVSGWIGTKDSFVVTAQVSTQIGDTGMGTVKRTKEFIIHPDDIKQKLNPGEAFYMTKVGRCLHDKVKVKMD